jgi:hypothetical protein
MEGKDSDYVCGLKIKIIAFLDFTISLPSIGFTILSTYKLVLNIAVALHTL